MAQQKARQRRPSFLLPPKHLLQGSLENRPRLGDVAIGARPHWLASSSNHVESRDCLTFEPLLGTAFRTVAAIVRAALEMRLAAEAERGERK